VNDYAKTGVIELKERIIEKSNNQDFSTYKEKFITSAKEITTKF